jgi:hypothetical protein
VFKLRQRHRRFFERYGISDVDLIQVDVEGSVQRVLDGMRKLLEKPGDLNLILEFPPPLLRRSDVDPHLSLDRLAISGLEIQSIDGCLNPLPDTDTGLDYSSVRCGRTG